MAEIVQVRQVFTPAAPARVTFVERENINAKLVNALQTPGKQIVVYGHSGSGKTTLLVNKLHQIYEGHITSRCMTSVTFDHLVLDAFDQLSPYYKSEGSRATTETVTAELSASYLSLISKISASTAKQTSTKESRILPPQLTPQNLGRFIGAAGCCWVLEDFHKIDDKEKPRLSQLMKVFMDMSDEFPALKIIALGAVDTARQVVDYDAEMKNRVSEIRVDLMSSGEILEIIAKGEAALNIVFDESLKNAISEYSSGLAAVCHHLCLNLCDAAGVTATTSDRTKIPASLLSQALKAYVEEASDSIKSAFDKALKTERKNKFDNAKLILSELCAANQEGLAKSELLQKIRRREPKFPNSNLEYFLKKLQNEQYGALVRYSPLSHRFLFADPFYKVFAMVLYAEQKPKHYTEFKLDVSKMLLDILELEEKKSGRGWDHFFIRAKTPGKP